MTIWKDTKSRIVTSVVSTVCLGIIYAAWAISSSWFSSLVHAEDLTGFADMVVTEMVKQLDERLKPIEDDLKAQGRRSQQNAADIRTIRIEALKQSIRDLTKEIQEMEARQLAGDLWTESDERLLEIWRDDLAELQEIYNGLTAPVRIP